MSKINETTDTESTPAREADNLPSTTTTDEIHRTHLNIRRLTDDVLRLAGEQSKLNIAFGDHLGTQATWQSDIIIRITNMQICIDKFHKLYGPILSEILERAKYWNDTRDAVIRTVFISMIVSIMAGVGMAVWFYVKYNITN